MNENEPREERTKEVQGEGVTYKGVSHAEMASFWLGQKAHCGAVSREVDTGMAVR